MARLRYNGLSTTLGASLTSSATAVTFAAGLTHSGGTAVPTIGAGDYIPLTILDSAGKASEIVYLTAYTAAATTGTITRAQESTTGVSHTSGDKVVHGPTALDLAKYRAEIQSASAQSIGDNAFTTVVLATTVRNVGMTIGSNAITVPVAGCYRISVDVGWAPAQGRRIANIVKGASTVLIRNEIIGGTGSGSTSQPRHNFTKEVDLAAGDSLHVEVLHTAGLSLNLDHASNPLFLAVTLIAAA